MQVGFPNHHPKMCRGKIAIHPVGGCSCLFADLPFALELSLLNNVRLFVFIMTAAFFRCDVKPAILMSSPPAPHRAMGHAISNSFNGGYSKTVANVGDDANDLAHVPSS